jgi:hypothetical protein
MNIALNAYRAKIDKDRVGFLANSTKVKPVHIANGTFRALVGKTANTELLYKFVFSKRHKDGLPPKGHDLGTVRKQMEELGRIFDIPDENLSRMRDALKSVLNADNGIFTDQMQSYSSASSSFISRDNIAQEGGEFFGNWLLKSGHELAPILIQFLERHEDIHSVLCSPLLSDQRNEISEVDGTFTFASETCAQAQSIQQGLTDSCKSFASHFEKENNSLLAMRSTVLFACFVVFNRMANLEVLVQQKDTARRNLMLFDFTHSVETSITASSRESYNRILQSVSRFYSWAFTQELISLDEEWEQLEQAEVFYRDSNDKDKKEYTQQWRQTALDVKSRPQQERLESLGATLYDLLASDNSRSPAGYMQALGLRGGLLWPATNLHRKSFRLHQDVLEVLLRGAVAPGETITLDQLQSRFKMRYGILIGGRPSDEKDLATSGIFGASADALRANRAAFISQIQGLSMARLLADGVLQIRVGGAL